MATPIRKKLIEVSIPLEAINAASVREKQIKTGKPLQLHHYWARRPLTTCRAVIFAQMVDDPSAWPDRFPTEEMQDSERRRLHKVMERMVPWEASNDKAALNAARWEIARSVAWGLGNEPPSADDPAAVFSYLQTYAPPVCDPFSGGASIPIEAKRLGLRAYGADLNPVAVLVGKAIAEIPSRFYKRPPVNPSAQVQMGQGGRWNGVGVQGLAEDVRYYGHWLRDAAEKRVGHLYPKIALPDGGAATAVAFLWARTVRSPDPAAKGAMVPLVSSFVLSTKPGKRAWVEPVIDPAAPDGYRFEVRTGKLEKADEDRAKKGTKTTRGNFACLLTGTPIPEEWNRAEGRAKRLGDRLLAVVAEGPKGRIYVSPTAEQEKIARSARPLWEPEGELYEKALGFRVPAYGLTKWADLFTARQLVALSTFSDLVQEVRPVVLKDAIQSGLADDGVPLHSNGAGATAYADAIVTYLALALDRVADWNNALSRWENKVEVPQQLFGRHAIPMSWDFAEANPIGNSTGSLIATLENMRRSFDAIGGLSDGVAEIIQMDAKSNKYPMGPVVISTDPPYYDNIGYADLSDFFYVWLKKTLSNTWPFLFRRLSTPKSEELVATPDRHGGRGGAEKFFMTGMKEALSAMRASSTEAEPLAIYYAFKQAELADEGITSAGWSSFLQAIVDAELVLDGTWPMRTEMANRIRGQGSNALASSIVLVCRKRRPDAGVITRAELIRELKIELPAAIAAIRRAGVGPVDMQQSVIGPGMGVFSRHAKVLEDDDSSMTVKTALGSGLN